MRPGARQSAQIKIRLRLFFTLALAVGAVTAGTIGCAINPATGRPALTGLMTTADEIRIGREQHPQILQAFGGAYDDRALNAYVGRVGQSLARGTERTDITYTFTILNSPIVNALATPGGYIYVTRGLLALGDDEAELAGVLGHELGHVTARHHAQKQSRQTLASIGMLGAAVAASAIGAPPVLLQGTQLAALGFLRAFSREEEFEADQLGARYVSRAGYDPHAMVSFLRKLQAHSDLEATMLGQATRAERFDFLATHPNTADRIDSAIDAAKITTVANPTVRRDSYLNVIDGMLYGAPPSEGFIRGRVYSHPVLRIRFEVPPEYQLFDTRRAVYAQGPGDALIILDSEPQTAKFVHLTMAQYVSGATRAGLGEVEAMRINGLEAATGAIKVQGTNGPIELRLAAIRTDPAHIYRFRFVTPLSLLSQLGPAILRTFQSFRTLTAAQAAALKPLRVRVVSVKNPHTVAALAKRMTFDSYAAERFRVLNGLPPGAEFVSGGRVKIITE
jgi:predicted Zn-dependent protease